MEGLAMTDPCFWNNKRVFLTGHTGFKGAWMSLWLQTFGAEVTGFALPPYGRTLFEDARVARGMTSIYGDLRDRDALTTAFRAAKPDIVIHMAAQALVRRSYDDPVET
jgi:CDP-glucose 4,6-dehydratase